MGKQIRFYNLKEVYSLEDDYWWFKAKRRLLIDIVKKFSQGIGSNAFLLDGGCGTGANLKEIQEFLPAVGIEKYFDGLELCKRRNIKNLVNATLEYLPFKDRVFDIVLAMDILEHVDNDAQILKEISRVSKKDAILIIHVPAFMFLWCDHDVAVDHKRRYVIDKLTQALKVAHYRIKYIRYRLCFFFLLGILKKYFIILNKFITKDQGIKAYRPKLGRLISYLLYISVRLEDTLLDFLRLPFGLSIICIAQKGRH